MGGTALKVLGGMLILAGLVLASNPELVSHKAIPSDVFQAVERRIWWGLLIGLGCIPLFHHQWQPWGATVAGTLASLLFGLLIARFIGIALDGSVAKQWLNVGIEIVIMAPLVWWYLKVRA